MEIGVSLSPTKSRFGPILHAGNLEEGLATAFRLGYDGVELSLLDSAQLDRRWVVDRLGELELKPYAIATGQTYVTDGCSLYSTDAAKRRKTVDRLKAHIDFAAELKCMVIIGGIRGRIDSEDQDRRRELAERGMAAIASCCEFAQRSGVALVLEPINRYETNVANTLDEGLQMIRELGSPCLGLLPDTFHMNIEERSLAGSIVAAGPAVRYVHFADSNRLAPGWGHLDFGGVLSALRRIRYAGPIGIEVLPRPDDLSTAKQAIRHVRMLIEEAQREEAQQSEDRQ